MADTQTVSDGLGGSFDTAVDTGASGQIQLVKLTYSADTSETHVPADADGILCNLGSNNDVTVTSGTVTVGAALPAGTNAIGKLAANSGVDIGDVDVTSLPALPAGGNEIGHVEISDGTTQATVTTTGGTHEGVAVALIDDAGDQLTFSQPIEISVTPTIDTSAYSTGDNLDGTILSFANAAASAAGSGWITKLVVLDKDNETSTDYTVYLLNASITPPSENAAFSITDTDAEKVVGVIDTSTDGTWYGYGAGQVCIAPLGPPIPFKLASGTTLYAVVMVTGTPTYATAADLDFKLHIMRD